MTGVLRARALARSTRRSSSTAVGARSPRGLTWLAASELVAAALGFLATVHIARRLGPEGFANVEHASVLAAWLLVVVRSGIDQIVQREAARHPRLIGPMTDLLIGLRCLAALAGFLAIVVVAGFETDSRRVPVIVAGLVLIPSALVADVGPRVRGSLSVIAVGQLLRSVSLVMAATALVRGEADVALAALVPALGELAVSLYTIQWHTRHIGPIRPTLRRRASLILARQGGVACVSRFLRVGLYAADLVVLGWIILPEAGAYAALRRVVFAALAVGLVVPAGFGPAIAASWRDGQAPARAAIRTACQRILVWACPAAVGLVLVGDRAIPWLFGDSFQPPGAALAMLAARLPLMLVSSLSSTALVACRREWVAFRLTLGTSVVAAIALLGAVSVPSLEGIAAALLIAEAAGAVAGWACLRALGIAPPWHLDLPMILLGCAGMVLACWVVRGWTVVEVIGVGAVVYLAIQWSSHVATGSGRFGPHEESNR